MREAPSLVLIENLLSAGCKVFAYDPVAMQETKRRIGKIITYAENPYEALAGADALFLVTEWTEFRVLNFDKMQLMKHKVVFDGRNIYDPNELIAHGFSYFGIGR